MGYNGAFEDGGHTPDAGGALVHPHRVVRIHFIIVMIRCTGLAFEFPFPGGGHTADAGGARAHPHRVGRDACRPRRRARSHPGVQGSYLRRIDSCITQLKAQVPSRTCNESKEEEKKCRAKGS